MPGASDYGMVFSPIDQLSPITMTTKIIDLIAIQAIKFAVMFIVRVVTQATRILANSSFSMIHVTVV